MSTGLLLFIVAIKLFFALSHQKGTLINVIPCSFDIIFFISSLLNSWTRFRARPLKYGNIVVVIFSLIFKCQWKFRKKYLQDTQQCDSYIEFYSCWERRSICWDCLTQRDVRGKSFGENDKDEVQLYILHGKDTMCWMEKHLQVMQSEGVICRWELMSGHSLVIGYCFLTLKVQNVGK